MPSSSLRDVLNSGNLNNLADAAQKMSLGEVLAYAISKMGFTETGIAVTANVSTLAAQPTALLQCVGITAGAVSTVKKLIKGPISGPGAITPATGECVWDGGLNVLFAAVDVAATASFTYVVATDKASIGLSDLPSGQSTL